MTVNIFVLIVEAILILVPIAMVVLELFLSFNDVEGDTISGIVKNWAYGKNFFITLAWGIITGHLFLGSKNPLVANDTVAILVVAFIGVAAAILGRRLKSVSINKVGQLVLFISGALIGHFCWSMNDYIIQ